MGNLATGVLDCPWTIGLLACTPCFAGHHPHPALLATTHALRCWPPLTPYAAGHHPHPTLLATTHTLRCWPPPTPCFAGHHPHPTLLATTHTLRCWPPPTPYAAGHHPHPTLLTTTHTRTPTLGVQVPVPRGCTALEWLQGQGQGQGLDLAPPAPQAPQLSPQLYFSGRRSSAPDTPESGKAEGDVKGWSAVAGGVCVSRGEVPWQVGGGVLRGGVPWQVGG